VGGGRGGSKSRCLVLSEPRGDAGQSWLPGRLCCASGVLSRLHHVGGAATPHILSRPLGLVSAITGRGSRSVRASKLVAPRLSQTTPPPTVEDPDSGRELGNPRADRGRRGRASLGPLVGRAGHCYMPPARLRGLASGCTRGAGSGFAVLRLASIRGCPASSCARDFDEAEGVVLVDLSDVGGAR